VKESLLHDLDLAFLLSFGAAKTLMKLQAKMKD